MFKVKGERSRSQGQKSRSRRKVRYAYLNVIRQQETGRPTSNLTRACQLKRKMTGLASGDLKLQCVIIATFSSIIYMTMIIIIMILLLMLFFTFMILTYLTHLILFCTFAGRSCLFVRLTWLSMERHRSVVVYGVKLFKAHVFGHL